MATWQERKGRKRVGGGGGGGGVGGGRGERRKGRGVGRGGRGQGGKGRPGFRGRGGEGRGGGPMGGPTGGPAGGPVGGPLGGLDGGPGGGPSGGPVGGSVGGPVGAQRGAQWVPDRGPVEPAQHKARGLATSLKKILNSARPGPLTVNGPIGRPEPGRGPNLLGPARWRCLSLPNNLPLNSEYACSCKFFLSHKINL